MYSADTIIGLLGGIAGAGFIVRASSYAAYRRRDQSTPTHSNMPGALGAEPEGCTLASYPRTVQPGAMDCFPLAETTMAFGAGEGGRKRVAVAFRPDAVSVKRGAHFVTPYFLQAAQWLRRG